MPSQFERFSEGANRTLSLAQEEAQRLNHNYMGTEHLLLGLIRLPGSGAVQMLTNLSVDLDEVRTAVERIIGRGETPMPDGIGLTPRARKVMELAVTEAWSGYHNYVGTGDLLIGIVREGEGVGAVVLERLGVTLDQVRATARRIPPAESDTRPRRGPRREPGRAPGLNDGDASDDAMRDPTPDEIRRVQAWQVRARGNESVLYTRPPSTWSVVGRRQPWWRRLIGRLRRG